MSTRARSELLELDAGWEDESSRSSTAAPEVSSGTFDAPAIPVLYDVETDPSESGTRVNEHLVNFAKLSNAKALPRLARQPRSGEPLDARAAHLLEFIDGRTPLGVIFDSAGMSEGDAVAALAQLVELGIILVR
jgi:hypothetical protein